MGWDFLILCFLCLSFSFTSFAPPHVALAFMTFEQEKGEEGHLRGFQFFLSNASLEVLVASGGLANAALNEYNSVHRNMGGL